MLFWRCDTSAQVRRRGQRLTVMECALLFYRALITTPVWFQYFEDTHLGSILTSENFLWQPHTLVRVSQLVLVT